MKKIITALFLVMFCIFYVSAYENEIVEVFLDNEVVEFDIKPQIIGGRTMVPLRAVFEKMGATVEWDDPTQTVTATKDDKTVVCSIGNTSMFINGAEFQMDVAPLLLETETQSRTLVPARFVAEAFDGKVLWSDRKREVYIFSVENSTEEEYKLAKYTIHFEDIDSFEYKVIDGSSTPGFVGRWFEKELDGVNHTVTLSDGSTCYFLTDGAESFNVNFTVITTGKTPFFAYSIDGSEPVRQRITEPKVKLPDSGIHKVCIWADGMTEGEGKWDMEKGFALKDITVESGTVCGIMPQKKIIAYYGDSITEGIRALNMCADSDGNSATNSFPYHCSKALGTLTHSVGYGATGIIPAGSFNTMINAIDNMSAEVKEIEGFKPDIIVVNHGTNDKNYEDNIFKEELVKALDRLVEKYPDVPVFYAIPFGQYKASAIREVAANYPAMTVVETQGWEITYTDGVHPNANGARIAGEKLAETIKSVLGEEFFKN